MAENLFEQFGVKGDTRSTVDSGPSSVQQPSDLFNEFGVSGDIDTPREIPSITRRIQYGGARSRFMLPLVFNILKAAGSEGDFDENMSQIQKEHLAELYRDYPEFVDGTYDDDKYVLTGDLATSFLDPVTMVPALKLAGTAAKVGTSGTKLLATTGMMADAAAYSAAYQVNETGEVDAGTVAASGLLGGAVGGVVIPVIAAKWGTKARLKNRSNEVYQMIKEGNEALQGTPSVERLLARQNLTYSYYGFTPKEISAFEEIFTENQPLREMWLKVADEDNSFNTLLANFKRKENTERALASVGPTGQRVKKKDRDLTQVELVRKQRQQAILEWQQNQAGMQSDFIVGIMEELAKKQSLSDRMIIFLNDQLARPVIAGGIAGAAGLLVGDTYETEDPEALGAQLFWAGLAFGAIQKRAMASKYIPTNARDKVLKMGYRNVMNLSARYLNVATSMTQATRLNAKGEETALFSRLMFNQHGSVDTGQRIGEMTLPTPFGGRVSLGGLKIKADPGNKSVESRSDQYVNMWHRSVTEALTDVNTGKLLNGDQQQEVVKLLRGYGSSNDPVVVRSAGQIREMYDYFVKYASEAGFTFAQEIPNYFTRVYNPAVIDKNTAGFRDALEQVVTIMYPNLDVATRRARAEDYSQRIRSYLQEPVLTMKGLEQMVENSRKKSKPGDFSSPVTFDAALRNANLKTPAQVHIERQRVLHTSDPEKNAQIERILSPYLVNDPSSIVFHTLENAVRSVEMSRTFGKDLSGVKEILYSIRAKYNGLRDGAMYHPEEERELKAVIDGVNSYFGRYGEPSARVAMNRLFTALTTASNFVLLAPTVTVSALGDLLQPIQNSKNLMAAVKNLPIIGNTEFRGKYDMYSSNMRFSERAALEAELAAQHGLSNLRDPWIQKMIGMNTWMFRITGLTSVTSLARRYAYNTGMEDAFMSAKKADRKSSKLVDLGDGQERQLSHLEYLQTFGISPEEAKILSQHDTFDDAFRNPQARIILERAGYKTAERDAKISNVGNRLLFVQSRNPGMRFIGQYGSWLQAKSAQVNEMISRIEDGDTKLFVMALAMLPVYAAQQDLRYYFSYGEFPENEGILMEGAKGVEMSGVGTYPVSLALGTRYNYVGGQVDPAGLYPIAWTSTAVRISDAVKYASGGEYARAAAAINPLAKSLYQGAAGDALGVRQEYPHQYQTMERDITLRDSNLRRTDRELKP